MFRRCILYISIHTEISRDFCRSNAAAQSFVFARDTSNQTKTDKTRNVDDKHGTWRMRGRKAQAERRFDGKGGASTNKQQQTTTTRARGWRQRLAQVRFSRQGNAREERKEGEREAGRRWRVGGRVPALTRPWSAWRKEKGARADFGPRAEPTAARRRPWRTTSSLPVWWRHGRTWRLAGPRLRWENSSS